jgi:hypothetical protein
MNSNLKNLIYAVLSIVIILPAILFTSDYIYFQEPLSRVVLYPDDPKINKELSEQLSDGYKCVEIKQDEFVCRLERGDTFGDRDVQSSSAGPISYGEIVSFPEGKFDTQWFNIENMKIIDKNSKTIQVDFNDSKGDDMPSNIIYTTNLKPNDTFLSCVNPWKSTHLVRYMDLYEHENKTYAEFWGLHPFTPPELFPCDMPKIIETSLKINYDIPLPEYEEFGFIIEDESMSGSESNEIDSGKINPEKQIPTFFEVMLMEQDIEWIMPQREWNNPDFEIVPPVRICSEILYSNGTSVFLSTVFQTHYTLSNMTFHNSLPEDCVRVLPVTEYGRK